MKMTDKRCHSNSERFIRNFIKKTFINDLSNDRQKILTTYRLDLLHLYMVNVNVTETKYELSSTQIIDCDIARALTVRLK